MSETTIEKLPAEKGTAAPKKATTVVDKYFAELHTDSKLTRVPVAHLYFATDNYLDVNECGVSQLSNAECRRPGGTGRYWVSDFVPAWQMFEVTLVVGPDSVPVTSLLPAAHIRRWKRG